MVDELADLLRLPDGHRLHAIDELPAGHCLGVALTITSDGDAAGAHLPRYQATDPLTVMDLASYRRWISQAGHVTRTALRAVEEPPRLVPRRADHQAEQPYTPARPPVTASPEKDWPKFPGEGLDYRGIGDEDEHFGGPR